MKYQKLELEQGTEEWKRERFNYVTASQVSTLFGLNPYQNIDSLLDEKLNKREAEVSSYKQQLFEQGHKAETKCREWIEKDLGIKFKPVVVVSRKCPGLLASLDGFNEEERLIFEGKYMGSRALEEVKQGIIKPHHKIQIQAQLLATGAKKCIYFALAPNGEAAIQEIFPDKVYHIFIPRFVAEFMERIQTPSKTSSVIENFARANG